MSIPACFARRAPIVLACLFAGACVLTPEGTEAERERAHAAGEPYSEPYAERVLPELGPRPGWRELVTRAFRANGELEAAFDDWRAALARTEVAAAWPDTNFELDYERIFSGGQVDSFDRNSFGLGFDPILSLPTKARTRGEVALAEARAAGERFFELRSDLQRRVLSSWLALVLSAERIRIVRESLELLALRSGSAATGLQAGGLQQELLEVELETRLAEDDVLELEAELEMRRAELNALLARDPRAALEPPETLPEPRTLAGGDAELLALGARDNHELAALAREVEGGAHALELARQQYFPDLSPAVGFTGSVAQFVGLAVSIPSNLPALRAAVEESRARLAGSEARLRQVRHERAADFVASLIAVRDRERQVAFLEGTVLPLAERIRASAESSYARGTARFSTWLDGERALLDVRSALAEARIARETRLAELEALAGIDIETAEHIATEAFPNE